MVDSLNDFWGRVIITRKNFNAANLDMIVIILLMNVLAEQADSTILQNKLPRSYSYGVKIW